ncbi:MAG: hypothetical protein ABFD79_04085 [Phycisphaerales bacterium]
MNKIINCIYLVFIFLLVGCSSFPITEVVVEGKKYTKNLIDPNNLSVGLKSVKVLRDSNGVTLTKWELTNSVIKQNGNCRLKYLQPNYQFQHNMVVEGIIGKTGKKYPVTLDTGSIDYIYLEDNHVLENDLPIYPLENGEGMCILPELRIGKVVLINLPCAYRWKHEELQFFGIPFSQSKSINIGLPVLVNFKFIAFDNVNQEVEFSLYDKFNPAKAASWQHYPLLIKRGSHDELELFVRIPISGKEMELKLDTGAGIGLIIEENEWEYLCDRVKVIKWNKRNMFFTFYEKKFKFQRCYCRRFDNRGEKIKQTVNFYSSKRFVV